MKRADRWVINFHDFVFVIGETVIKDYRQRFRRFWKGQFEVVQKHSKHIIRVKGKGRTWMVHLILCNLMEESGMCREVLYCGCIVER